MKVLVVGSGGREHALCTMCTKSPEVSEVFVAPGNPGMKKSLPKLNIVNIEQTQVEELLNFALNEKIFCMLSNFLFKSAAKRLHFNPQT